MKQTLLLAVLVLLFGGCSFLQPSLTNINRNTVASNVNVPAAPIANSNILDLSNRQLARVPNDVFNQTNLVELNISNNQLTGSLQAEIRHLQNLRVLKASNNHMTGVPAEIGQLTKLEILDLSNNQLTGLPNELGNLKNLKVLNLSGNQYSQQDLTYITSRLPVTTQIIK